MMFVLAGEVRVDFFSGEQSVSRVSYLLDSSSKWVTGGSHRTVWRVYLPQINTACPVPGLELLQGQLSNRSPGSHHYKRGALGTFSFSFSKYIFFLF